MLKDISRPVNDFKHPAQKPSKINGVRKIEITEWSRVEFRSIHSTYTRSSAWPASIGPNPSPNARFFNGGGIRTLVSWSSAFATLDRPKKTNIPTKTHDKSRALGCLLSLKGRALYNNPQIWPRALGLPTPVQILSEKQAI